MSQAARKAKWRRDNPKDHATEQRKRYYRQRARALDLMGYTCGHPGCGLQLDTLPLDGWGAHHITPRSVTGRPSINWGWAFERIKAELLNDMVLLCAEHHKLADQIAQGLNPVKIAANELKNFNDKNLEEKTDEEKDTGREDSRVPENGGAPDSRVGAAQLQVLPPGGEDL